MSAVDFLFSPGIQKVLGQVYADPARSFTLNELLAGSPPPVDCGFVARWASADGFAQWAVCDGVKYFCWVFLD